MKRYYVYQQTPKQDDNPGIQDDNPGRKYPSGELIPESLPESYQPSQNCGNCAAYDPITTMCSTYSAPVVSTYWCSTWRGE